MKLIIFHGPGVVAMNEQVIAVKKQFDPLTTVELGKGATFESISTQTRSNPLFSQKRLLILNDIDHTDFNSSDDDLTILLISPKLLTASLLQSFAKYTPRIVSFPEEKELSIFPFLDKLAEKDPIALADFEALFDKFGSQYILTMLVYLLRRNILTKKLPSFVAKKLSKQKKNFNLEKIKAYYLNILETDYKIKSGLTSEKEATFHLVHSFLQ